MYAEPDRKIWGKVNRIIKGENAGVAISTLLCGMSMILVKLKICDDEFQARAHLAAMLLSPYPDRERIGELMPLLEAELERLGRGRIAKE